MKRPRKTRNRVVAILKTFSERFAQTCEEQDFPVDVAIELQRQNQLMGTDISLEHCANRLVTADFDVCYRELCTRCVN
jgi:hypothetical protein